MKKGIHPEQYRPIIFRDTSSGERFLISSTVATSASDTWSDGKEYPLVEVEVSSASHPFYTGQEKIIDTAGRVEKFKARLAQRTSSSVRSPKVSPVKQEHVKKEKKTKS